MRKIHAVGLKKRFLVGLIRCADGDQEAITGIQKLGGVNELLGDLVEVTTRPLDRSPAGFPFAEKEPVFGRPDYFVKVLEDKEKLGQFIERLIVVAERRAMPVLSQHTITEAVNRGH